MEIKSISYPTALSKIDDIDDDNVDVFVELDDGITYVVVVGTAKNLVTLMDRQGLDYLESPTPHIIVRRLNEEIIRKAMEEYVKDDNAYWIKFYRLVGSRESCFSLEAMEAAIAKDEEENRKIFADCDLLKE